MMNPWPILAAVLSLIGSVAAGYAWGSLAEANAAKAEKFAAVTRAIEQANRIAAEDAQILATADIKRAARRERARQLDEEIAKNVEANPAYAECGLDADGLRLWNAANADADIDLPGQRGNGLPPAPLGEIGKALRSRGQPQGNDRPLPRLQSQLRPGAETRE